MDLPSQRKRVLITGASSGIGYELALGYLQEGAQVFVLARSAEQLGNLVAAYPQTCIALVADLSNSLSAQAAGIELATAAAHLNLVILNAGTCEYIDVKALDPEAFNNVMAVNWQGVINTLLFALPLLRKAASAGEAAHLVGVSSMATVLPLPRSQAYGASKVALEYLLNSLRVDLAGEAIDISIVRPGFVKTPLTDRNDFPMPFLQTPQQAAQKIMRGIAQRKLLISFPWQLVVLMRTLALLPTRIKTRLLQKLSRNNL